MLLLLLFAFLSGLVTILAPCIWPLLPIILSASVQNKGHQRPLGITLGIISSFAFFTLAISSLVQMFHFDPNGLRIVAVAVIGFLGLTMIIPALNSFIESTISRMAGVVGKKTQNGNGFWGGFTTGLSLGIVWSPCAGPILAAIATLASTGKVTTDVVLVTISYVIGVGIPLFIFAYGGQQLITRAKGISQYTGRIQQIFGVIMLLTALAIYTNYDKYLQTQLLNAFPFFSQNLNQFESNPAIKKQLDILKGHTPQQTGNAVNSDLFNTNTPASEFSGITKWLNLPAGGKTVTLQELKGKVVLVDFWTYTCINCIRTLPHVTSWYDTYHDKGFVVIGVHTPEFAFEHDTNNVLAAIKQYNIHYPVAQDNNYTTWNAYSNEYWPAEYLIDANGIIRRTHFGEGEYDQMEQAIQTLLKEAGQKVTTGISHMPDQTPQGALSPETYVGSKRMQYLFPNGSTANGSQTFSLANNLPQNMFSFGGNWDITDENAITGDKAVLEYNFTAGKVFLVLRPPKGSSGQVKVFLDGKVVDDKNAGDDVKNGILTVDQDRLYNLVNLHGTVENHSLRLEFLTPGTQTFAFTFG